MDAEFSFTTRASPFAEIGIGDTRDEPGASTARWNDEPGIITGFRWNDAAGGINTGSRWAGIEPLWLDVSCFAHQWESFSGRHRVTDRFEPGTLTLTASNETGWADIDPDDIAALTLRPGRQIRVGVWHEELGGQYVLWRGWIDNITPGYSPDGRDIVTIEAIDSLGEVGRVKLAEDTNLSGAGQTGDVRCNRILTKAQWLQARRDIDPSGVPMIATRLGGQVADVLTQLAESEGGAVFGDQFGMLCFRARDWQAYDATVPPDAVIGNVVTQDIPPRPAHLVPTVGTVTTPDFGTLPATFTLVAQLHGPTNDLGVIAGQWDTQGSWGWRRHSNVVSPSGYLFDYSPDGVEFLWHEVPGPPVDETANAFEWLAITVIPATGSIQSWASSDGVTWELYGDITVNPFTIDDSPDPVCVGAFAGVGNTFVGSIVSAELRDGATPTTGTVVWRFDANEMYFADNTTWTDPRGRTWTITDPTAWVAFFGGTLADLCPTGLELSFDRRDIATQVILGREGDEFPRVYDDIIGQSLYGVEPYDVLDLVCQDASQMDVLGNRLLKVRGRTNAPRLSSVDLAAARDGPTLDFMTTCDVFKPTRVRTRFARARGEIYNRQNFVTGIEHFMSRDEWTCRLSLDPSSPWALTTGAGRWNDISLNLITDARWNRSTWVDLTP